MKSKINTSNLVSGANEAYKNTLSDILNLGVEIHANESPSIGSNKKFKEILNYHLILKNPTQRLLTINARGFNLPGALARFVWMMAANNRLADIEFYWGLKVSSFSDDDFTVPGSSYGARMFNASPGLDQIEAVIKRLKEDPSTRRAAVSIYHPIDAIRSSKDIPCTFGIFYHIRDNKLISTVVMRSNNAFILLPYNIFEFSLLAEIIAKEVGVEMGVMHYNALSMHIYEDNYESSLAISTGTDELDNLEFPPMPFRPKPMEEVKKLIRLEAKIRHTSAGLNNNNIDEWLRDVIIIGPRDKDKIELDPYWKQFYYLLLYFIVSKKTSDKQALKKVADLIEEPYRRYLDAEDLNVISRATQLDLFGNVNSNPDYFAYNHFTRKLHSFETICHEYNLQEQARNSNKIIDFSKYLKLREKLVGDVNDIKNIAARNDNPEISKEDFLKSVSEFFDE